MSKVFDIVNELNDALVCNIKITRWCAAGTIRFGISIDGRLLAKFDDLIETKGHSKRSGAIRGLIRNALVAHHCLEVVVLKGTAKNIKRLAEELIGTKGVKHGQLMTTTTGKGLI